MLFAVVIFGLVACESETERQNSLNFENQAREERLEAERLDSEREAVRIAEELRQEAIMN